VSGSDTRVQKPLAVLATAKDNDAVFGALGRRQIMWDRLCLVRGTLLCQEQSRNLLFSLLHLHLPTPHDVAMRTTTF